MIIDEAVRSVIVDQMLKCSEITVDMASFNPYSLLLLAFACLVKPCDGCFVSTVECSQSTLLLGEVTILDNMRHRLS